MRNHGHTLAPLAVAALLLLPGCRPAEPAATEAGPPAAALQRLTGTHLHEALGLLDRELAAALREGVPGGGEDAFVRSEAISDRLLETRFPFDRLRVDGYSVQARIRQIQAQADRVDALLRTNAPNDSVVAELRRLRREVLAFRQDLAQGGTARPVPLERLLAGRDTLDLASGEGASGE